LIIACPVTVMPGTEPVAQHQAGAAIAAPATAEDFGACAEPDGTFTYTYNPRNQLTLVKQANQTRGNYTYDGLGRRVVRTIGNSTTKPAYDGWNLVQERASNGNSVTANYLTGLDLDQPLLRTAGSSTSYYLSDALGSIVGLADQTGGVPTTYTYEPYGKTTVSGTSSASFFGFTGRENDSTGTLSLYNYRMRAYSPTLQRFLSEDPINFHGGDPNLYRYVSGNPIQGLDPLGTSIFDALGDFWQGVTSGFADLVCGARKALQVIGQAAETVVTWLDQTFCGSGIIAGGVRAFSLIDWRPLQVKVFQFGTSTARVWLGQTVRALGTTLPVWAKAASSAVTAVTVVATGISAICKIT
jgi:RHS repeat-associated protein